MIERGLWLPRKQRRRFHQPRNRRECFGELIQIDGSDHRWFEDRHDPCTLLVFIDDATSQLMTLRFVRSESTFSYFEALEDYLSEHGRPVAFYSDKHTVFRNARPNEHGNGMTQFGRALAELNIEILCANTSQAKGRVERANRTLQDRLVKELRLKNISDMDAGNAFLKEYKERFNQQFTKPAAKPDNLHRVVNVEPNRLRDVLCLRDQRHVGQQLTFKYNNRKIMLEVNDKTRGLVGKYVDTFEMADGRLRVRWKGLELPYSVFDNGAQRINQVVITDNKRLGAALAMIKLQQEENAPPIVGPSSAKNGYKKRGRKRRTKPATDISALLNK